MAQLLLADPQTQNKIYNHKHEKYFNSKQRLHLKPIYFTFNITRL
jgi:hypothetical protein